MAVNTIIIQSITSLPLPSCLAEALKRTANERILRKILHGLSFERQDDTCIYLVSTQRIICNHLHNWSVCP